MSRNDRTFQLSATMRGDGDCRQQYSPRVIDASPNSVRPRLNLRNVNSLLYQGYRSYLAQLARRSVVQGPGRKRFQHAGPQTSIFNGTGESAAQCFL